MPGQSKNFTQKLLYPSCCAQVDEQQRYGEQRRVNDVEHATKTWDGVAILDPSIAFLERLEEISTHGR